MNVLVHSSAPSKDPTLRMEILALIESLVSAQTGDASAETTHNSPVAMAFQQQVGFGTRAFGRTQVFAPKFCPKRHAPHDCFPLAGAFFFPSFHVGRHHFGECHHTKPVVESGPRRRHNSEVDGGVSHHSSQARRCHVRSIASVSGRAGASTHVSSERRLRHVNAAPVLHRHGKGVGHGAKPCWELLCK